MQNRVCLSIVPPSLAMPAAERCQFAPECAERVNMPCETMIRFASEGSCRRTVFPATAYRGFVMQGMSMFHR